MSRHRLEQAATVLLVIVLIVPAVAWHGWPNTVTGNIFIAAVIASGLVLMWWRRHPRWVALAGGALWLFAAMLSGRTEWIPDTALTIMALLAAVAALGWTGRAAWVGGAGLLAYLVVLWLIVDTSVVAVFMFSVPGYFAGTVLRLRREAAAELDQIGRELEEERELFADLAMRHERARIAAELHDIVGHAISVMIIQAAAGQRLVEHDPVRAGETFTAIAESARQGREDLQRLVDLLGGTAIGGPDLSLIDEVVTRAARSGLDVTCRFEGDRDGVAAPTAHVAFRVVQESLTNALRYAPGAAVRVLVTGERRRLTVVVENDPSAEQLPGLSGTGRGLTGMRERVQQLGGQLMTGPTHHGGWLVRAELPA